MKSSSSASVTSCDADDCKHLAQQLTQPHDQCLREFRILVHQLGDGMQRIEQEMRVELAAQGLQLRLVQQRLELHGLKLPVTRFAVVVSRVPGEHEARVHG